MRTLLLLLLAAAPARAAFETGAAFLTIDPSARSAALGGAYTAAAGMADSAFFNPAGLAAMTKNQLMAGHAQWLAQTSFDTLALGLPVHGTAFGLTAVRLSAGSIDARTADRASAGSFQAQDAAYGLSMARSVDGF
ncbi:MAG: UPF0164 family protein, partial [Elusimicrobia bacterium]|nr:UPF0164 family protein [Elusimicrobiota bacterium]